MKNTAKKSNEWSRNEANAQLQLISAAPEMYAALKDYVDHIERDKITRRNSFYRKMKKALVKADGNKQQPTPAGRG